MAWGSIGNPLQSIGLGGELPRTQPSLITCLTSLLTWTLTWPRGFIAFLRFSKESVVHRVPESLVCGKSAAFWTVHEVRGCVHWHQRTGTVGRGVGSWGSGQPPKPGQQRLARGFYQKFPRRQDSRAGRIRKEGFSRQRNKVSKGVTTGSLRERVPGQG